MLQPWNDSSLLPPPILTAPTTVDVDVKALEHICKNMIMVLSKQLPLHKEGAIVSRFLYKFDKKFRSDIGYRYFKKLNTALHRYLAINLLKDIERFESALPRSNEDYLPTRQMLQYILVRLLTFSKIVLRMSICSKQAAIFYLDRLKRGDNYWMSLMPYALLSRVWSISKVLLNHSTRWYISLYSYHDKLKLLGLQFLPTVYKLPNNIEDWLDLSNVDNLGRLEWSQKTNCKMDIILDDDNDMFDNILRFIDQTSEENLQPEPLTSTVFEGVEDADQLKVSNNMKIDCGEAISRESFHILCNTQIVKAEDNHLFPKAPDKDSIIKFIDKETLLRNDNNKMSLTSHLSFMQWQVLKNTMSRICSKPSIDKNKLEKKIRGIWKDKCLDYLE